MKNFNLGYNKMTTFKELKDKFKKLNLSLNEVRKFKKSFNIKGQWNKEKLNKFFRSFQQDEYNMKLFERAQKVFFDFDKPYTKEQLKKFVVDREKKDKRNKKDRERRFHKKVDELLNEDKFQKVFDLFVKKGIKLTERQTDYILNKLINDRNILTFVSSAMTQSMPINNTTVDFIRELLSAGGHDITKSFGQGSDIFEIVHRMKFTKIILSKMRKPSHLIKNKDGAFFPYVNTSKLDLERYQIYNQEQAYNSKIINNREHCLIQALYMSKVSHYDVSNIKLSYIKGASIAKKDLHDISDRLRTDIHLYTIDEKTNKIIMKKFNFGAGMGSSPHTTTKQKSGESVATLNEPIKIALYENHYFIYEDTKYSKFFISHYKELEDIEEPNTVSQIIKKGAEPCYKRDNDLCKISSLQLVHKLKLQGYFKKLDLSLFAENSINKETRDNICLDNIENEQRPVGKEIGLALTIKKTKLVDIEVEKLVNFADCESFVYEDKHKLYMLGVVSEKSDFVNIWNVCEMEPKDLIFKFMNYVSNNGKNPAIVYFHNLKYDLHILEPYLNVSKKCVKDNQIYSITIRYKNITIELRDSMKLVSESLSKFQKIFDLPKEMGKKEAIGYTYYKPENNNKIISIDEYKEFVKEEDKDKFIENMKTEPSYNKKNKTFNPLAYYKEYLRLDCLVLKKGLIKFNEIIGEITGGMSIYESLTISSLTDKYMIEKGAYKGVYEVCGNLREYISKAVYGGRVCVNEKYVKQVVEGKISDYDGVSLYPSSINRLCREIGLPTGKAVRLDTTKLFKNCHWLNCDSLENTKFGMELDPYYYILTVKINKVGKKQQMPFLTNKVDGIYNYTNEAPKEPIIIDSITLQDYINFHEVEFEVLDGIYWTGEYNKKMGELISNLFNERVKYKKDKPIIANIIKLMLNSSYGKTIMKKSNKEVKMIYKSDPVKGCDENGYEKLDNFQNYVYNNFNTILSYRDVNSFNYEITKICADTSYNRGHIGCAILSMSKRIMNEVFNVANDNELPIYYTDTDSIHINMEDVPKLETKYKEVYGKELNGKNLEQFHTDFNLEGAKSEIYATKSIFLGKKSYIDCLESTDKNGNIITGYHYRLKGITEAGLKYTVKNEYKEEGFFGLYKDLANGEEKTILLNPPGSVRFEYNNGSVLTRGEFTRKVKF